MHQAVVVSEPVHVEEEVGMLGMSLSIAQKIARAAAAGKASALDVDVAFAPGMLSHIYGNRHLCLELLPRGWKKGRFNNVESVINHDLGIQIIFQNVDLACDPNPQNFPKAISGKGAGSRKLVEKGLQAQTQIQLWENPENPPSNNETIENKRGLTPLVWMFCVSNDGTRLRAEISKPTNFESNQFESFSKRIFVLDEECGTEPDIEIKPTLDDDDDGAFDFDIQVSKK